MTSGAAEEPALAAAVAARRWYHTMRLAPSVVTPGWFDTRGLPSRLGLPARLDGRRCLDVGTFDGFWAFEMERRGASEVVATDVPDPAAWDWPPGSPDAVRRRVAGRWDRAEGFALARRALDSDVRWEAINVYDLDPGRVGRFDFVYLGSLLLHLRDPVRALDRIRRVCRDRLLIVDAVDWGLTLRCPRRPVAALDGRDRPWWWRPNRAGLVRMVRAAGFEPLAGPRPVWIPPGAGQDEVPVRLSTLRTRRGRRALLRTRVGDPHLAIAARPRVGAGNGS